MDSLPQFDQFKVHCDPHTAGLRWEKWIIRFERLMEAINVVSQTADSADQKTATDKRRLALLLHYAGTEVEDVFDTLPGVQDDKNTYSKAKPLFQAYFQPKKNVELEVFNFRRSRQEPGENMDAFATRLRQLATRCDFNDSDLEIKLQIIQGCKSSNFRKLCLRDQLSLKKMLENARAAEAADRYAESVEQSSKQATNSVNKSRNNFKFKSHKETGDNGKKKTSKCRKCGGQWPHTGSPCPAKGKCRNCGYDWPHPESKPCPAKGKKCEACGMLNHFSKCCTNKKAKPGSSSKQEHTRQVNDRESSSDESTWTISPTRSDDRPLTHIKLCGGKCKMMIDTGSTCNLLSFKEYNELPNKPTLHPTGNSVNGYGGNPLKIIGKFKTLIESKHAYADAVIYVSDNEKADNLLGYSTAKELKLVKVSNSVSSSNDYSFVKQKFGPLFSGLGKMKNYQVKLHIDQSIQSVTQKHRRIGFHLRKGVDKELTNLENEDIIEPVTDGPTEWISPCHAVPKPKQPGKLRVCVDMRAPNKAILRTRHIIPTIEDLVVDLNGAKYFSKLDMNQGYHQLELAPESRYITTFSTHRGLFRYKRLNFGMNCASEIFDDVIRQTVSGIPGVVNRSDDIFVTGKTKEEHDSSLEKVLKRLMDKNLTLNFEKCEFGKEEIDFFGLHFSGKGVSPTQAKVEAIKKAEPPSTPDEVSSFLGMVTYCSRFIPNAAAISEPLRRLTHTKQEWVWKEEQEKAFKNLKKSLCKAVTLSYFDVGKPTSIVVDASPRGLGAILTQVSKDGSNSIIAYASRLLTDVESRYSQTEREALAITWAILHFHLYVTGKEFTVITDHKPLEAIFNKPLIQPPARIERWLLKLQLYDFTVIYQPGKSNPADYMSRHPIPSTAVSTREQSIAENYVNSICMKSVPKPVPLGSITSATKEDKAIQLIFKILNQKRCKKEEVEKLNSQEKDWFISLKQIQLQLTRIETEEGEMLLKDTRIVIPHSLTEKIIDIAHQGHQGIVKTKALLREKVWFPGIDKAVERKVTNCIPCQACSKKNSPEPLQMSSLPAEPWTEVSIDFADMPMGEHLLVVYDDYSRYPVVTKVSSTSAKVVTKKLEDIFAQFGIPEVVKSDNGPPFQSYDFKQFAQDLNFKHRRVTPLWPQANGGVERFMKTLKKALRCAVAEKRNWREEIPRFLLNYRNSPHASTGKAPATLLFGRSLRTRLPQIPKIKKEEEIRNKDLKSKSRMKENADKKAKHRELKEGDFVLLRRDKLANKLQAPFDPSPYRITEVKKSMITAERNNKKVTRNVTFFKKIERKDEESEESEESEDEYYHKALENVNFPEQIQVPVHDDPQQNEPVEEPENANDAPPAGVQLPVEGTQAYDGDTVQRAISVARARLLEALVRNPPPNELVRPTRVQSEPTSPEESTRPKRNRQPPKRLDDFVVNMFHSKKGK